MQNFKTQIEESLTADFQEKTWTFEMPEDFKIKAGKFAIVPIEDYNNLPEEKLYHLALMANLISNLVTKQIITPTQKNQIEKHLLKK